MFKCPEQGRRQDLEIEGYGCVGDDGNGVFVFMGPQGQQLHVIASNGVGWEHVSVHGKNRPTEPPAWEEMCYIKKLFWSPEDVVVQFHPRASEYVNNHSGCLHLWRKCDQDFDTPPACMVGVKDGGNG